jgi:starvation-inducible DNA-binding protein
MGSNGARGTKAGSKAEMNQNAKGSAGGSLSPPSGLGGKSAKQAGVALQIVLAQLIDLSLQLKQLHWNVTGTNFRSVHEQLDEIVAITRSSSDAIAERAVTLGLPAVGDLATVAKQTKLDVLPTSFVGVAQVVRLIDDRLQSVIKVARDQMEILGELDPVSEDLVIGTLAGLEKAGWMVKAQLTER